MFTRLWVDDVAWGERINQNQTDYSSWFPRIISWFTRDYQPFTNHIDVRSKTSVVDSDPFRHEHRVTCHKQSSGGWTDGILIDDVSWVGRTRTLWWSSAIVDHGSLQNRPGLSCYKPLQRSDGEWRSQQYLRRCSYGTPAVLNFVCGKLGICLLNSLPKRLLATPHNFHDIRISTSWCTGKMPGNLP